MESGFAATVAGVSRLINVSLEFKRPGDEDTQDDEFEIKYESKEQTGSRLYPSWRIIGNERLKAALKEYQKASRLGGDGNPMIQNGVAESDRTQEIC